MLITVMKLSILIPLLLIAFIGISGFGFLGMNHDASMTHGNCSATVMMGTQCPEKINALSFLSFHINAMKNVSLALWNVNLTIFLLFIIVSVLIFLLSARYFRYSVFRTPPFYTYQRYLLEFFIVQPLSALLYWLALHEHTPAVA